MASSSPGIEQTQRRTLSAAEVRAQCSALGFDLVGITDVRTSEHEAFYRAWLEAGRHGEMGYLSRADAVERRVRPHAAHPELRSAIVLGINYSSDQADTDDSARHADSLRAEDPSRGIIARYARGRDYHKVIRKKLIVLLRWLEEYAGTSLSHAHACVDTSPVLERELAQRAGLGWFGRSSMLINPKHGSYFFLATLLVELDFVELDAPFERDHCGTCSACVDVCPTGALLGRDENGAPVIDATRCISYQTIENRGPIPHELRPLIGNRIFGCDICQEVCPWNGAKFVSITRERDFEPRMPAKEPTGEGVGKRVTPRVPGTDAPSLIELMGMDEAEWDEFSHGSAIRRAKRAGFLRNVAVALGNWGSDEAVPVLVEALSDSEPLVRGHAAWALGRIASAEARAALAAHAGRETDGHVREELLAAIAQRQPETRSAARPSPA
ncbi:MAG: tRNA epoxyqueuosine(34) reductase QueG [Longimicrobiales bacterium]